MQDLINRALRKMGTKYLKKDYKDKWSENNPTRGYCYVVSEVLYHYYYIDTMPYILKVGNENHWFLKDEDGKVMDYTADQYIFKLDYTKAKRAYFLTKEISNRGKVLANLLGVQ